jgi:hypothetical protein
MKPRFWFFVAALVVAGVVGLSAVPRLATEAVKPDAPINIARMESAQLPPERGFGSRVPPVPISPEERQMFADAAATAWRYVEGHYHSATGLADATTSYAHATVWDIASTIAALYAAHELKLLETVEYDRRMRRVLRTLKTVDLYDSAAFNKVYATRTGEMIGHDQQPSKTGYGWSATDGGRLLIWLKILAVNQPQYRDDATAVVGRMAMNRLVKDGYLWGEDRGEESRAPRVYQEGQIGYEQYAARGFALWGFPPLKAMSLGENGVPITVMGRTLLADIRGRDRVTSDPLVLMGLELGWDRETARLAGELLAAQEERYRKTGRVTIVGEDAIGVPPHYFYYYSAYAQDKHFAVDVQDARVAVEEPRWVSTKAAFAWHVLLPSAYTDLALRTVAPARTPNGWSSGVYEASGKSTDTLNINTAGVILTAALVHTTGKPLLSPSSTSSHRAVERQTYSVAGR